MWLNRGNLIAIGGLVVIVWLGSIVSSPDSPEQPIATTSPSQSAQNKSPDASPTASPTFSETASATATATAKPTQKPTTKPAAEPSDLESLIAELVVAGEMGDGYDRDLFRHWIDADGDGCNTRKEVLIAEAKVKPSVTGDCDLIGGQWYSVYDQVTTNDPSDFDIDHFVPLKEAWDSGAYRWSAETRKEFANDLGFGGSLIAVTASSNRSKSDRDPSDWLPTNSGYQCRYITNWVKVKLRWELTVDPAELTTLKEFGRSCK